MNRFILCLLLLFANVKMFAQYFICNEIIEDIRIWNAHINENSYTKWANEIIKEKAYKQNSDGSFEYVYILNSTDSVDIETLRNVTLNYIVYHFNINNASRADMEISSPKNGVIFHGKLTDLGEYGIRNLNVGIYNRINGNVYFDVRFKPDRIRFSIKIQDYHVQKYQKGIIVENYTTLVKNCFPLNPKSNHKKSFAMAFVNANKKCLELANLYLEYLNRNVKTDTSTTLDEW